MGVSNSSAPKRKRFARLLKIKKVQTVEPPTDSAVREFCDGLAELIADAICNSNAKEDEQP